MTRKSRGPGEPLATEELGVEMTNEDLRTVFVDAHRAHFELDTTNPLPAFDALSSIVSYWWERHEVPESGTISIPWWAGEIIAWGYQIYRTAHLEGRSTKLGEAYGIEGGGQGKQPRIRRHMRVSKDRDLALWVALELEKNSTYENAVAETAERCGVSESNIARAWRDLGEPVKERLRQFRRGQTSRSVDSDST